MEAVSAADQAAVADDVEASKEAQVAGDANAPTEVQARPVRAEDERVLAVNPNYILD